jgi:hypothetical protein
MRVRGLCVGHSIGKTQTETAHGGEIGFPVEFRTKDAKRRTIRRVRVARVKRTTFHA